MTRGKFIIRKPEVARKRSQTSMIASNILLLTGSLVIVSLLTYLLFNLDKSDSLVTLLTPFFIAGIILIIVSQLICPFQFKSRR